MKIRLGVATTALLIAGLLSQAAALGQGRGAGGPELKPFFDSRVGAHTGAPARAGKTARVARERSALRARLGRSGVLDVNPLTGTPRSLLKTRRRPHRPQRRGARRRIARSYLRANATRSGCRPRDVDALVARQARRRAGRRHDPALPAGLPRDPGLRQRRPCRARPRRPRARRHRLAAAGPVGRLGHAAGSTRPRRCARLQRSVGAARAGACSERPDRRAPHDALRERRAPSSRCSAPGRPAAGLAGRLQGELERALRRGRRRDRRAACCAAPTASRRTRRASSTTTPARPRAATPTRRGPHRAGLAARHRARTSAARSRTRGPTSTTTTWPTPPRRSRPRAATSSSRSPRSPTTARRAARRPTLLVGPGRRPLELADEPRANDHAGLLPGQQVPRPPRLRADRLRRRRRARSRPPTRC